MNAKTEVYVVALVRANNLLLFHKRPNDPRWHLPTKQVEPDISEQNLVTEAEELARTSFGDCVIQGSALPQEIKTQIRLRPGRKPGSSIYRPVLIEADMAKVTYAHDDTAAIFYGYKGKLPRGELHRDLEKILDVTNATETYLDEPKPAVDLEDMKTRPQEGVTRV